MPALLTSTSIAPQACDRRGDQVLDVGPVADVAAHEAHRAERADLLHRAAAGILVDVGDRRRARRRARSARAMARPIPFAPPVTIATLFSSAHAASTIGADHAAAPDRSMRPAPLARRGVPKARRTCENAGRLRGSRQRERLSDERHRQQTAPKLARRRSGRRCTRSSSSTTISRRANSSSRC